jgi:hypothetical protein
MICSGAEPRCPEYYSCNDDRHCDYGGAAITYSPAEPVANEPVTFTAHFFYNKTRTRADWLFDMNGLAQQAQGETATVMFTSRGEVTAGFVAEYADEAGPQQAMVKVTIH